jgi:hypothetical protein
MLHILNQRLNQSLLWILHSLIKLIESNENIKIATPLIINKINQENINIDEYQLKIINNHFINDNDKKLIGN